MGSRTQTLPGRQRCREVGMEFDVYLPRTSTPRRNSGVIPALGRYRLHRAHTSRSTLRSSPVVCKALEPIW